MSRLTRCRGGTLPDGRPESGLLEVVGGPLHLDEVQPSATIRSNQSVTAAAVSSGCSRWTM